MFIYTPYRIVVIRAPKARGDGLILTYKVAHGRNFDKELSEARAVALYVIQNRDHRCDDTHIPSFNLKPNLVKGLVKKYTKDRSKTARKVASEGVKLVVMGNAVKLDEFGIVRIPPLDLALDISFSGHFERIRYVEIDEQFAYITVEAYQAGERNVKDYIGVDINTAGHMIVAACPKTGKVWKLGKDIGFIYSKYNAITEKLYEEKDFEKLEVMKRRFKNIINDHCHKISKYLVDLAIENGCGIKFEALNGSMKTSLERPNFSYDKNNKSGFGFKYTMDSFVVYKLLKYTTYKCMMNGVPVRFVDPNFTSQTCSKCGAKGERKKKVFTCPQCGNIEDANCNAAMVIALRSPLNVDGARQLHAERDTCKGICGNPDGRSLKAGDSSRAKRKEERKKAKKKAKRKALKGRSRKLKAPKPKKTEKSARRPKEPAS
jgi:putative transposase